MPVISSSLSVGANAVSANVFAGEMYEQPNFNAILTLLCAGSAAGLRATLVVGGTVLLDDVALNANNRTPIHPDDLLTQEGVRAGEKISLRFRNTTAGALTAFFMGRVDPV